MNGEHFAFLCWVRLKYPTIARYGVRFTPGHRAFYHVAFDQWRRGIR